MKSGVVASSILHVAVLTWGLWSLSAPKPFEVTNAEALPVDLVPIESLSQSMVGEKEAPKTDKPAPKPTEKPQELPMPAEHVGDNETDLDTPPTPVDRPKETKQASAASAPPEPAPLPEAEPEPAPAEEPAPKPEPVKETKAEPTPQPPAAEPEPTPDAVEKAIAAADAEPLPAPVPQNVPLPADKPVPPKPVEIKTAEAKPDPVKPKETKVAEAKSQKPDTPKTETKKPSKTSDVQTPDDKEFDADKIAALLNKEKSAGGGAKRSTDQASLGTERKTGAKLSQSEIDALRGQISKCWSPPAGVSEAGSLRISIQMRLDPSGQLEARPQIVDGADGSMIARVAGEAALRAVQRCAPYNLPADKYDTWADVTVNFDPSQMF